MNCPLGVSFKIRAALVCQVAGTAFRHDMRREGLKGWKITEFDRNLEKRELEFLGFVGNAFKSVNKDPR